MNDVQYRGRKIEEVIEGGLIFCQTDDPEKQERIWMFQDYVKGMLSQDKSRQYYFRDCSGYNPNILEVTDANGIKCCYVTRKGEINHCKRTIEITSGDVKALSSKAKASEVNEVMDAMTLSDQRTGEGVSHIDD